MASRWYRQGHISVTNASKLVAGSGTNWLDAGDKPLAGDVMLIAGQPYEIESIDDNESLSLFTPYLGQSAESVEYSIVRNASINISTRIAASVSNAINSKQQLLNEIDEFLISTEPTVIIHDSVGKAHAVTPIQTLAANLTALVGGSYNLDQMIQDAQDAAELSGKYANAAEGEEVKTGEYSAKHWAAKAQATVTSVEQIKSDFESSSNQVLDDISVLKQSVVSVQDNVEQKSTVAENAVQSATEQAQSAAVNRQAVLALANQVTEDANTVAESTTLARKWADEPHNSIVEATPPSVDGNGDPVESEIHYSAKHWAFEAQQASSEAVQAKTVSEEIKGDIDLLQQQQQEQLAAVISTTNAIKEDQAVIQSGITKAERDLKEIQAAIDNIGGDIGGSGGDIGNGYRRLTDYEFTEPETPLDIGRNKIVSGLTPALFVDSSAVNVGSNTRPIRFHVNSENNIEAALPGGETKKIAWLTDIKDSGSGGIIGDDGKITTITFDADKAPSLPDIISRSSTIGSHVLRQFSGKANSLEQILWHESVQGENYRLSTGQTANSEIFSINAKTKRAYVNQRKILVEGDAVGGGAESVPFEVYSSPMAITANKRFLFDLEQSGSDLVCILPNGQIGDSFVVGIYGSASGRRLTLTPYANQKVVGLAGGYDLTRDRIVLRFDYVDDVIGWNIANGANLSYSTNEVDAKISLVNADISQINSLISVVKSDISGNESYDVTLSKSHFIGNKVLKVKANAGGSATLVIPNGLNVSTPLMLVRIGEGDVIITGTESVSIQNSSQGNALSQQYSVASLLPLGNDQYVLIGDVTSLEVGTYPDV
nr:hypothetical protein [uncultured Vibrio sp.]